MPRLRRAARERRTRPELAQGVWEWLRGRPYDDLAEGNKWDLLILETHEHDIDAFWDAIYAAVGIRRDRGLGNQAALFRGPTPASESQWYKMKLGGKELLLDLPHLFFPSPIFRRSDVAPFIKGFHQVPRVLDLQGLVHGVNKVCDVIHRPPSEQILPEKMCVHSVSRFSQLVEARFEGVLCVFFQ